MDKVLFLDTLNHGVVVPDILVNLQGYEDGIEVLLLLEHDRVEENRQELFLVDPYIFGVYDFKLLLKGFDKVLIQSFFDERKKEVFFDDVQSLRD